jgi:chromosome segregation protein
LSRLEDREQQHLIDSSGISAAISSLEARLQQQKLDSLNLEKNLSVQQKATNEFISKIRAYESDKKLKNEQLRFLEDKKNRLSEELEKDRNQLNHVFYNQKRLNEEHLQESEILEALQHSVRTSHSEIENLRTTQQKARTDLYILNRENNELQNQVYKLEKDIAILNIQKDALHQESNRNVADTQAKEGELTEFNKVIASLKAELEAKENEFNKNKEQEQELQQQISNISEQLTHDKEQLNQESRRLDAKQNEYNLTKSMVDNLEGFPESIRFLKKNTSWAKHAPLFSDILFCKEEYRIAIENYLEPVMNHYVVETHMEAVQAIRLLSEASRGRANFFVLEGLKSVSQKVHINPVNTDLVSALDIIDTDAKYRPLCEMLLYNVFMVQSGEDDELKSGLPSEPVVLLSKSGTFSKTRTGMSGGSVGLFEGKRIGRAKNLEKLAKEINSGENTIAKLKNLIDERTLRLNSLKASSQSESIQQLQFDINRLSNDFTSVKTKQEQYLAFIENSQNRKQDIELKINSITNELLASDPRLAELKTDKQIKQEQLAADQQEYNQLSELLNTKSAAYNQENIKYHQQQNKVSGIVKDLEYRESQQQSLETRISGNNTELETTQLSILETLQHSDHSDDDLIAMYAQKEEFEKAVQEAEQNYYASRGMITESENNISDLRRNKEQADVISNEIKDQKTAIKLDLNALKERLAVEFDIDISSLLDEESTADSQHENEQDLREKTERIKRQLDEFGAVNPMAMEAYQEMDERYVFIQNQKKDLAEAKSSLLQTIKEIDDTAKEKFMEAFVKVREHFIEVFRSLFNQEDSCDLVLVDPENPLESDIDILARPKGKRPLSINQLSGGEKTLTATAILFSLYLLKPAPFCIFDEVDAPLDDTNIDKFNNIIREFSGQSQFIIVSHNKRTIASTDIIYGVTMAEQGVSRVVAVDIREVA